MFYFKKHKIYGNIIVSNEGDSMEIKSILEIYNIETKKTRTIKEFDYLIEAPNWNHLTNDLIYNANGLIFKINLNTFEVNQIDTGHCDNCNNDHVLSSDFKYLYVSHSERTDYLSRIYKLPIDGGTPELITKKGPSYLHGASTFYNSLAYCAERNGQYDVYVINEDTLEEIQLTNVNTLDDGPEYYKNHIWFNSGRSGLMQIYRMNHDGSDVLKMTHSDSNNWFPHVSPNGKKVVYLVYEKDDVHYLDHPANKNVSIRMMDYNGEKDECIIKLFGGQGTINVNSWSKDSLEFAYVRYVIK